MILAMLLLGCDTTEDASEYSKPADPTVTRPEDSHVLESEPDDSDSPVIDDSDSPVAQTDWELLGGEAAVSAVLDAFLANVAADTSINWMFASSDLVHLKQMLLEQISSATGGPYAYTGGDMASVHANMAITDAQFGALVGDLLTALDSLGVPYTADFSGDLPADRLILVLASMQPDIVTDAAGDQVLFNQLGGYASIQLVVTTFVANVAADDTINWMFANSDLARLEGLLVEQICEATGGYCVYSGGDMAAVHADMAITDAQWNALVGDLLAALDTLGVPYTPDFSGGLPADSLILALAAMYPDIVTDPAGDQVLFNQLGGHAAVQAVIDGMLVNVAADSRINAFFASTDLDNLNRLLVEQVCEATGGYCVYSGRDMLTTHTGLGITEADFNALVEDLLLSLDNLGVPYTAGTFDGGLPADSLIQALAAMQPDIVGH
jgi:hemoglobin